MTHIDAFTLFVVSGTLNVVLAGLMLYVYATEKTYPGFRDWVLAAVFQALGFLLLTTKGVTPATISSVLGSALMVASADRFLRGAQRFTGLSGRIAWDERVVYAVCLAGFSYFDFVVYRVDLRIVIFSVSVAYVCAKALVCVLGRLREAYRADAYFIATLFGLSIVAHLVRAAAAVWFPAAPGAELLARGTAETLPIMVSVALVVSFVGAFLKINAKRLNLELEAARAQVRQLEGIIPICMYCKKIRDDGNSWRMLEKYLADHSTAQFSHGLCPECAARVENG